MKTLFMDGYPPIGRGGVVRGRGRERTCKAFSLADLHCIFEFAMPRYLDAKAKFKHPFIEGLANGVAKVKVGGHFGETSNTSKAHTFKGIDSPNSRRVVC